MALVELDEHIVFAATDGDVALLLMTTGEMAGLVLMGEGRVMKILLKEPKDVDLIIQGLEELKKKMLESEQIEGA